MFKTENFKPERLQKKKTGNKNSFIEYVLI